MCWKHWSIYRQCLPNSHSIKTTTQPLLELNLFEPDWNTDVKYVQTKLQNKFQENKNNTPVGIHSQKQFAMQRASSDTRYYRFEREDGEKKKKSTKCMFHNRNTQKIHKYHRSLTWYMWELHWEMKGVTHSQQEEKKRKPRDLSPIDSKHSLKHN